MEKEKVEPFEDPNEGSTTSDGAPRTEITITLEDGRKLRVDPEKYDDIKTDVEAGHAFLSFFGVLSVLALVGLTVYFQHKLGGGWKITTPDNLLSWGLSIQNFQEGWSSLFSHVFVHAGWKHLIGNMVVLLVFGLSLGARQGPFVLLAVYFLGGAVGGIFGMVTSLVVGGLPLIGASGAVFAVMGASALVAPGGEGKEGKFPWKLAAVLFFILAIPPLTSEHFYTDRVSHSAHLAGIASGVLLFLVFVDAKLRDRYRGSAISLVIALFLVQRVLLNGSKLLALFKEHGLVLPWTTSGEWAPWLWIILGAIGVLGASILIVVQAEEIEEEKVQERKKLLYAKLAEVGEELPPVVAPGAPGDMGQGQEKEPSGEVPTDAPEPRSTEPARGPKTPPAAEPDQREKSVPAHLPPTVEKGTGTRQETVPEDADVDAPPDAGEQRSAQAGLTDDNAADDGDEEPPPAVGSGSK